MKRRIAILLAAAAAIAVFAGARYLYGVARYREQAASIVIDTVEFGAVADGTYEGGCDIGLVAARVRVTVSDGAVTQIELLEHKNGRGEPAERLVGEMVERQTLEVDCVAGATNSSMVIRKAVENALKGEAQ